MGIGWLILFIKAATDSIERESGSDQTQEILH